MSDLHHKRPSVFANESKDYLQMPEIQHLVSGFMKAYDALYAIACAREPWEREGMIELAEKTVNELLARHGFVIRTAREQTARARREAQR